MTLSSSISILQLRLTCLWLGLSSSVPVQVCRHSRTAEGQHGCSRAASPVLTLVAAAAAVMIVVVLGYVRPAQPQYLGHRSVRRPLVTGANPDPDISKRRSPTASVDLGNGVTAVL